MDAMGLEGIAPTSYPMSCNYSAWSEPAYAMDPEEGNCYDVLWQLVLFRESPAAKWRSWAFSQMHMGFGGSRDSRCSYSFAPRSNPTSWMDAQRFDPFVSSQQHDAAVLASMAESWDGARAASRSRGATAPSGAPWLVLGLAASAAAAVAARPWKDRRRHLPLQRACCDADGSGESESKYVEWN